MLSVENFQKVCKYDPGWVEERRCNVGVLLKRIPPIIQRLFKIWWDWRHEKKIPMHFVFVYFLYFILFDMIKLVSSFVYTLVQVSWWGPWTSHYDWLMTWTASFIKIVLIVIIVTTTVFWWLVKSEHSFIGCSNLWYLYHS